MKTRQILASALMAFVLIAPPAAKADDRPASSSSKTDDLFNTISALDGEVFDAFNHCDSKDQLQKYAGFFVANLEFYHDNGGVTWTRKDMVANTAKNVAGHFRRELIPGTMKVYPIKDFGAIETGTHRFCQIKSGDCDGMAEFVIVWRHHKNKWQITRVFSYGHRPLETPKP